jgi:hypothetical protein
MNNTPKTVEDLKQQVVAKLKRAYFNGTTDVIARKNGVIPNDTKLGEYQIELLADELITALNELRTSDAEAIIGEFSQYPSHYTISDVLHDQRKRAEERLQK